MRSVWCSSIVNSSLPTDEVNCNSTDQPDKRQHCVGQICSSPNLSFHALQQLNAPKTDVKNANPEAKWITGEWSSVSSTSPYPFKIRSPRKKRRRGRRRYRIGRWRRREMIFPPDCQKCPKPGFLLALNQILLTNRKNAH